jgi:ribosomal protein L37AE/L43A
VSCRFAYEFGWTLLNSAIVASDKEIADMVSCGNTLSRNYKALLVALKSSGSIEKRAIQPLSKERCTKTRCRRVKRRLWPQGCNLQLEKIRKIPKTELQRIAKIMRDLAFSMDRSARVDE